MSTQSHARAYVALLVIAVLWASYPAAIKLALRDMPPLVLAALRCTMASLFLVTILAVVGYLAVSRRDQPGVPAESDGLAA